MCERCKDLRQQVNQAEYGAELSTEKWLQAVQDGEELAAALAEARLRLARIANIAASTDVLEFHRLRSAIDDIAKVARGGLPVALDK